MPRTNTQVRSKKPATKTAANGAEEQAGAFPKIKKAVEIEEPETVLGVGAVEEKVDEDGLPVPAEEDEELATDEAGIDDEEVNPFGDKWEE